MAALDGVTIVECEALGPVPFAAMYLADMGADVIRIARPADRDALYRLPMGRGRTAAIAIDLKHKDGVATALDLIGAADILLEGFRPGVMERLGLGPDVCATRNSGLIYGRMTGWRRKGSYADQAGHDLNYLGVTGALHAMGSDETPPAPPLNLIADFGGGAMMLVAGVLGALYERSQSGVGQIVDVAMVDGVSTLNTMFHDLRAAGLWTDTRRGNLLDGGAPFYRVYRCADGKDVSVAALEPQFYAALLDGLDQDDLLFTDRDDPAQWPSLHARFEQIFGSQDRTHWEAVFAGSDACVFPVLDWNEATAAAFAPPPSAETDAVPTRAVPLNARETLARLGYAPDRIAALVAEGIVT